MASGSNTHHWHLEIGEDRCIYLIRAAKRIGKVVAARLIRETADRPALIGVCVVSAIVCIYTVYIRLILHSCS